LIVLSEISVLSVCLIFCLWNWWQLKMEEIYICMSIYNTIILSTNYVGFSWCSLSSTRSPKNARKQKTKLFGIWEGQCKQMEICADAALGDSSGILTFSLYMVSTLICLISICWIFAMLLLCWIIVGWNVCILLN
jgi:hypothetical protein